MRQGASHLPLCAQVIAQGLWTAGNETFNGRMSALLEPGIDRGISKVNGNSSAKTCRGKPNELKFPVILLENMVCRIYVMWLTLTLCSCLVTSKKMFFSLLVSCRLITCCCWCTAKLRHKLSPSYPLNHQRQPAGISQVIFVLKDKDKKTMPCQQELAKCTHCITEAWCIGHTNINVFWCNTH